jgi:hypothetical protein
MRALSIKQPWAYHIGTGRKALEVRTWAVGYRGPLCIVASAARAPNPDGLPLVYGATVALVELVDIREGTGDDEHDAMCDPTGAFVWVLENPRPLAPRPVIGRQSLYTIGDELVVLASGAPSAAACACHRGSTCDIAHDPAACSCRQCTAAEKPRRTAAPRRAKVDPGETCHTCGSRPPLPTSYPWCARCAQ